MREWEAGGLITVGTLIALASAVRATNAFLRYRRSRKVEPNDRRRRAIAGLQLGYSNSLNGVLCGGGLVILVAGLVVGSLMQPSVLVAPAGLMVAALFNARLMRSTLEKVLKSDPGDAATPK
jgi:hypothetical protein